MARAANAAASAFGLRLFTASTSSSSGVRSISGTAWSAMRACAARVYSRTHAPGRTRPARPRRGRADALLIQAGSRHAMSFSASYDFSLLLPQSTTYTTSSIVMEVSAMFVARITLRAPRRGRSKISRWCAEGICPCRGRIRNRDASPRISSDAHRSRTFTISSQPVRNTSTAPATKLSSRALFASISSRRSVSSASAATRRTASRTSSTSSASSAAQFAVHRCRLATTSARTRTTHSGNRHREPRRCRRAPSPKPSQPKALLFLFLFLSRARARARAPRPRPRPVFSPNGRSSRRSRRSPYHHGGRDRVRSPEHVPCAGQPRSSRNASHGVHEPGVERPGGRTPSSW